MDPKIAKLDPKLKEAYERVMGTQTSPPSNEPQPNDTSVISDVNTPQQNSPSPIHEAVAQEPPPLPPLPPASTAISQGNNPEPIPPQEPTQPNHGSSETAADSTPQPVDLRTQALGNTISGTPKVFQSFNVDSPTASAPGHKSNAKISPMVLVLAAVVFFAVYAFLWIRVFNIGLF